MQDFLAAIATRGKPVADIEEGHISTASCILANLAMKLGRTLTWDAAEAAGRRRRRGQPPAAAAVPPAVGPPGGRENVGSGEWRVGSGKCLAAPAL